MNTITYVPMNGSRSVKLGSLKIVSVLNVGNSILILTYVNKY